MKLMVGFALAALCACASTNSSSRTAASNTAMDGRSCPASYVAATADTNTNVFERPDATSGVIGSLSSRTTVCASTSTAGFGYRRVRLANGTEGYVVESALVDSSS